MKVDVISLERQFGKTKAVDKVSFSFESGGICGFVGPNGAGKTTTMRIMSTLDDPSGGDVMFDGMSVAQNPEEARRRVGFVPDTLPEYADITVHEYLDFFARAYGIKGGRRVKVVEGIEEFTNVQGIRWKLIRSLSKGMKQRVSLGRALINDPDVMILDEPAAGLDPRARVELRELLFLLAKQGKAIFISSHILSELTEMCDSVVIIEHGRILANGLVADVTSKNRQTRRVLTRMLEDSPRHAELIREMPGVLGVTPHSQGLHLEFEGGDAELSTFLTELVRRGCPVVEFKIMQENLEDVFMRVTKGDVA